MQMQIYALINPDLFRLQAGISREVGKLTRLVSGYNLCFFFLPL
jgi:hypothetical protein